MSYTLNHTESEFVNKKELIAKVSKNCGISQKITANVLASFLYVVEETLSYDEDILLVGFGKFHVIHCIDRVGRHPQNGSTLYIPATRKVRFTAGKILAEAVSS